MESNQWMEGKQSRQRGPQRRGAGGSLETSNEPGVFNLEGSRGGNLRVVKRSQVMKADFHAKDLGLCPKDSCGELEARPDTSFLLEEQQH